MSYGYQALSMEVGTDLYDMVHCTAILWKIQTKLEAFLAEHLAGHLVNSPNPPSIWTYYHGNWILRRGSILIANVHTHYSCQVAV